jgi:hypothetical protein
MDLLTSLFLSSIVVALILTVFEAMLQWFVNGCTASQIGLFPSN